MAEATSSFSASGVPEDAVEQSRAPGASRRRRRASRPARRGRPGAGRCRSAASNVDRRADLLVRADRDERRDVVVRVPEARAPRRRTGAASSARGAVLDHPVVVEELREVRAAAVREEHEHARVRAEPLRDLDRGPRRRAGRSADEQALLAREPARGEERVAVGDAHPFVDDLRVQRAGQGPCRSPRRSTGPSDARSSAVKIEPSGSTPTISTSGFRSLK